MKELKRNVPFIGILMPCSKATTSLCSKAMLDDRVADIPQGPFDLELDEFGLALGIEKLILNLEQARRCPGNW